MSRPRAPKARTLRAVEESHARLYVAYGSNHNIEQMKKRCPDAEVVSVAKLTNYRLVFSSVLTIEPHEGSSVPVSIWRVSLDDIAKLDRYEGYPWSYRKREFTITLKGRPERVFVYLLNEPYEETAPSRFYYKSVAQGFADFDFPIGVLDEAVERAENADYRRARERARLVPASLLDYNLFESYLDQRDRLDAEWASVIA